MKKNVLEMKEIWKVYKMGEVDVQALRGTSMVINEGDFAVIMGPSGSGKSTMLQIIGCLDLPTSGQIFVDSIDTSKMNSNQLANIRNKKIGFVFQSFNLLPKLNALENCALPMIYNSVPMKKRKEIAKELLTKVGLGDRLHHRPNQLSGGQQQRVAIARSLANNPPIVLADEPTGNLDSKSSLEILKILHDLHGEGRTIVVVTHDPDMVHEGTKIIWLKDGQIERIQENGITNRDA